MSTAPSHRPQELTRYSFGVYNVTEPLKGSWHSNRPNRPRRYHETFDNIDAAVERGMSAGHKGKFLIVERDSFTGETTLHLYMVRKKSRGERRYRYAESKVVHDEYAEKVVSFVWPDAGHALR